MSATADTSKPNPSRLGCSHYARKCSFISPCCKKEYSCRVCHNDNELHEIDRTKVQQIKCLACSKIQSVRRKCEGCDIEFGKYFCEVCRLYDDEDKGQFHCEGCGLCRIGGKEKFFHCDKCDMCLGIQLKGKHKCVEESSRRNCAVCLEDLHTSRISAHIPACGHLIHKTCLDHCLRTGNYACPICAESLVDMKQVWKHLDEEVANTPMPDEYKNYHVFILCRDCHQESDVIFHVIGMKCAKCGSYNTCRTGGHDEDANEAAEQPISNEDEQPINNEDEQPFNNEDEQPIRSGSEQLSSTEGTQSQTNTVGNGPTEIGATGGATGGSVSAEAASTEKSGELAVNEECGADGSSTSNGVMRGHAGEGDS